MKLTLGPSNLQTEFEFTLPKSVSTSVHLLLLAKKTNQTIDKIGVYLSGGLDSAALLCLILAEMQETDQENNYSVHCFTVNKSDCFNQYAKTVLKKTREHYGFKEIEHVIFDNDSITEQWTNPRNEIGPNAINYVYRYHSGMRVYMACNRMAPEEYIKYTYPLQTNHGYSTEGKYYNSPFLFLHKPQMLDIFFKLKTDHLIQYCHSCVLQEVGECGVCYSCEERAWGFKMLGKKDPTIVSL